MTQEPISASPYQSLLRGPDAQPRIPGEEIYGPVRRVSDAHPRVLHELVFGRPDSQDPSYMSLGVTYAKPGTSERNAHNIDIRLSTDLTLRARVTLETLALFKGGMLPAGLAVLTEKSVFLGAPVQFPAPPMVNFSYTTVPAVGAPASMHFGIERSRIVGARIVRTAPDRANGTFSVQFWTPTPKARKRAPVYTVHLIFGLDQTDAQEWLRALTPQPENSKALPEWASTRCSLEVSAIPMAWRAVSPIASVSCLLPAAMAFHNREALSTAIVGTALLSPLLLYSLWRELWLRRLNTEARAFETRTAISE